jgi:hypothetical protein
VRKGLKQIGEFKNIHKIIEEPAEPYNKKLMFRWGHKEQNFKLKI